MFSKTHSHSKPVLSVKDHTLDTEAFKLSFAVENSLLISKVPKLVEFVKKFSKDINGLQHVKMDLTAATYDLRDDLSFHNYRKHVDNMNKYTFGINVDECMSNSDKRVLSILVIYFDEMKGYSWTLRIH